MVKESRELLEVLWPLIEAQCPDEVEVEGRTSVMPLDREIPIVYDGSSVHTFQLSHFTESTSIIPSIKN